MRVPPEMPTELVGLVKGDIHRLQLEANKKGTSFNTRSFFSRSQLSYSKLNSLTLLSRSHFKTDLIFISVKSVEHDQKDRD